MARQGDNRTILTVALWMFGALASFVVVAVSIRTLTFYFNIFEINLVRTGGGLVLLLGALAGASLLGRRVEIDVATAIVHIPRNLVHWLGGLLWTAAISLLPLATVFALEFTAPAWAALLAFPLLSERIRRDSIIGIAACLVGVLIILRPSPGAFTLASVLPLAAALCFALTALLTRRLTRTESTFAILIWMMTSQFILNLPGVLLLPGVPLRPGSMFSVASLLAMTGLAVAGLSTQLCLSKALQVGEASLVLPLDFLRVPLIAVIGYLMFGEAIDVWVFVGSLIIMIGILIGLLPARRPAVDLSTSSKSTV